MVRKWLLKIEDDPQISLRKFYQVRITEIERNRKPNGITVTVQHLSPEQEGRCHSFTLPVPIRVSGLTARFFGACNLTVTIGEEIEPKSVAGRILLLRFTQNESGDYEPVEFRNIKSSNTNDAEKHQEVHDD